MVVPKLDLVSGVSMDTGGRLKYDHRRLPHRAPGHELCHEQGGNPAGGWNVRSASALSLRGDEAVAHSRVEADDLKLASPFLELDSFRPACLTPAPTGTAPSTDPTQAGHALGTSSSRHREESESFL